MFKFGFELEGFYKPFGQIEMPRTDLPTDGFPGLVEIRNDPYKGGDIEDQYFDLLKKISRLDECVCFQTHTHTFKPQEKAKLLSRGFEKGGDVISNIYGKNPKALGNKTIASFQINFSKEGTRSYKNEKGVYETVVFSEVFDFIPIIRALDETFEDVIKDSGRQPGWYSVKDHTRVEYRSLPNCVFEEDIIAANGLINKINSCFK